MRFFRRQAVEDRKPPSIKSGRRVRQVSRARFYQSGETPDIVSSWTKTPSSPDEVIHKQLAILVARSRQMMRATDWAPQFVRMCENNLVGNEGFRFCAKSRDANGELDKRANQTLEYAHRRWGEDGYCDFNRRLDSTQFDKLLVRTVAVDGEAFVEELPGERYGISFRMHDPLCVPIDYHRARGKNTNLIRFGIEYDRYDRPTAYYVLDAVGDIFHAGKKYTRIPASRMEHIFVPLAVGQRRGIPWMASSLFRMKMLTDFEDAALQNAKVGASKVGILSGEGASEIVDEIDDNGDRIVNTEYVGLYQVEGDVSFDTFDTKFPAESSSSFRKDNLRSLASGLGVNYNTMASDLEGVSYSGLKHGTNEEHEVWKGLQSWFISDWKRRQGLRWLKIALLVGIEKDGIRLRPDQFEKYSNFEYRGRRWNGPDPSKEASANAANITACIKSRRQIIIENGDDPDEVFEQLAEETKLLSELGVPVMAPNNMVEGTENEESNEA